MNWKAAVFVAVLTLPLLALLAFGFQTDPHAMPSTLVDKVAPTFELDTVDGETVSLEALRGTPVVLNFWATWCEPCKLEHALLQSAAKHFKERVKFVGIVYQDEEERVAEYLAQRGHNYPQVIDEGSRVGVDYGVTGVPETYFIDAAGKMVHKHVGVLQRKSLDEALTKLGVL